MRVRSFRILVMLSICLSSCASGIGSSSNTPFILAPNFLCQETDVISRPSYSNKAVYVLLDNSASYQDYYVDASHLLQGVLIETLRPGDFVGIGLIGAEAANVRMLNTVFPHPQIPTTPSFFPTPTALPMDAIGIDRRHHEIESEKVESDNADRREKYYCSIETWNKSYDLSATNRSSLPIFQTISQGIPKQSQSEESTDIQSAMFNAHDFFDQARKQNYSDLKLIVFSDLAETEPPREWLDSIDLSGVFVTVAMVPFDTCEVEEVTCLLNSKDKWEYWFGLYQVAGFELLTVANSNTSVLAAYVGN